MPMTPRRTRLFASVTPLDLAPLAAFSWRGPLTPRAPWKPTRLTLLDGRSWTPLRLVAAGIAHHLTADHDISDTLGLHSRSLDRRAVDERRGIEDREVGVRA